jgi:dephospho-CoA kinase
MSSPRPVVVAISGPIGAGKTTVTALLAGQLGWPRTAYGDVVRSAAAARGLPARRDILQHIGAELTRDWPVFTRAVLDRAGWRPGQPLILDGLRHVMAAEALRHVVTPLPVTADRHT